MSSPESVLTSKGDSGQFAQEALNFLNHIRSTPRDVEDLQQFFAFAAGLARQAKGQLFQDVWALWEKTTEGPGYFVEFGAANGVLHSNSYMLEKAFGWSGIVAEPNPVSVPELRKSRGCTISEKCVFSRSGEQIAFLSAQIDQLSRIRDIVPNDHQERGGLRTRNNQEVMVDTISLHDLLVESDAPHRIDYMSVDTEGSEFEILSSFDFSRWDIRIVSIEHNRTPMREPVHGLMTKNGYRRKWTSFTCWDDWYVKTA